MTHFSSINFLRFVTVLPLLIVLFALFAGVEPKTASAEMSPVSQLVEE